MLNDNFLRDHIIQQPCFSNPDKKYKVYKSFEDGNLIKDMDLYGPYILIQMYLDGFGLNNAIGSITSVVVYWEKQLGVITSDESKLEFSQLKPSWGTSIFELKLFKALIKNYNQISKFSTSIMIITNSNQLYDHLYEFM